MVTQMIGVGEATGAMDAMLQKIADFYEDEVDAATKDMLTLLEPLMIGFLGVAVGGIVVSLYHAAVLHDRQALRIETFTEHEPHTRLFRQAGRFTKTGIRTGGDGRYIGLTSGHGWHGL